MKEWYSAGELMRLPGMPAAKTTVIRMAEREAWKSQPRAGKGGGREYHWKSFPKETQNHISRFASLEPQTETSLPAGTPVPLASAHTPPTAMRALMARPCLWGSRLLMGLASRLLREAKTL